MNRYDFVWYERHSVSVKAETLEEAQVMKEAYDSEETKERTFDQVVRVRCAYHPVEVNDDNPCEKCAQEEAEEREGEYRRGA